MKPSDSARPLALLIPGIDGTGELFYRQVEALAVRYRVRPWSYGRGDDVSLESLVHDLGNATAGEPPGSILVAAESFGGLVALSYVLRYPERVRRVLLVNTFPYFRWRLRIRLARLLVGLLQFRIARRTKDVVVDRTLRREGIPLEARQRYLEIVATIDREGYRRRLQMVQETDLRPRLHEIKAQVILLAAGRDKVVPSVASAREMAACLPCVRVHEFPRAGHALMLTPGVSLADYEQETAPGLTRPGDAPC